jgi:hypothetical protein
MLVDARQQYEKEPRAFGNKRNRITDTNRAWIETRCREGWKPDFSDENVKVFRREDFAYHQVSVVFWQFDEKDQPAIITEPYEKAFTAANLKKEQEFYDSELTFHARLRNGKSEPLTLGDDANINLRVDPAAAVEAPLVFVGYGLNIPERNINDLAGLNLKGAVVVYISATPASLPGPLQAHFGSADERWKMYKAAGAIGTASIANPKSMDVPWARATLARARGILLHGASPLKDPTRWPASCD